MNFRIKHTSRIFAILLISLLLIAGLTSLDRLNAQGPESHFAGNLGLHPKVLCTNAIAAVRSCPLAGCRTLFTYPDGAAFYAVGTDAGNATRGADQWVQLVDQQSGQSGYIDSSATKECDVQSWQARPVIPAVSETAKQIYQRGLQLGNNPYAFSKVGDCQNVVQFFLADFDHPGAYDLGPYSDLKPAIDNFKGSFERQNVTVGKGFNIASVLSPLWSNLDVCHTNENPLECEYRLHKPSIVIISMETWWAQQPTSIYEDDLRQIVEFWIQHGVVPILATKADNMEGDNSINISIARVADEYDIPLWNFWAAVQPLPTHGLIPDNFHLTYAHDTFGDPQRMQFAWPIRNLTALQALNAVWQGVAKGSK